VFSLSSYGCIGLNQLSGRYSDSIGLTAWVFDGNNIQFETLGMVLGSGTYRISGNTIHISGLLGMSGEVSYSFSRDGDTIYIDGTGFTR